MVSCWSRPFLLKRDAPNKSQYCNPPNWKVIVGERGLLWFLPTSSAFWTSPRKQNRWILKQDNLPQQRKQTRNIPQKTNSGRHWRLCQCLNSGYSKKSMQIVGSLLGENQGLLPRWPSANPTFWIICNQVPLPLPHFIPCLRRPPFDSETLWFQRISWQKKTKKHRNKEYRKGGTPKCCILIPSLHPLYNYSVN